MAAEHSVSVIGLGAMGSALAQKFVENGWRTTVWNRSSVKAHQLAAKGAVAASSVAECVGASPLVIICLLSPTAFHDVLQNVDSLSCGGRVLIDYTSGTRTQTRQSQELAMNLSFLAYLRGAILATPAHIGQPDSSIYYAGDQNAFLSIKEDFKILGRSSYLGDDPSLASLQGCIMMDTFFGMAAGFLQSVAVLKSSKKDTPGTAERFLSEELIPLLTQSYPKILRDFARQIDNDIYLREDGEGMPLSLLIQTLQSMMHTHSELGLSSAMFTPILELMQDRAAHGGEAEEMSSLIKTISRPT